MISSWFKRDCQYFLLGSSNFFWIQIHMYRRWICFCSEKMVSSLHSHSRPITAIPKSYVWVCILLSEVVLSQEVPFLGFFSLGGLFLWKGSVFLLTPTRHSAEVITFRRLWLIIQIFTLVSFSSPSQLMYNGERESYMHYDIPWVFK